MPAEQWKRGPAVVERCSLAPVPRSVALIAGPVALERRAGRVAMWILVTGGAFLPQPVVLNGFGRTGRVVAVGTWNRLVAAGQRETRLRVIHQGVAHRLPPNDVMALLAAVPPRCAGKLPGVAVLVAAQAGVEGGMEVQGCSSSGVAVTARYFRVSTPQRVAGLRVRRRVEKYGLPARLVMTGSALPTRPGEQLSLVLVAVAIHAALMRYGCPEVGRRVALLAVDGAVQAHQRKLRAAVIESGFAVDRLPVLRGMALLAVGRECPSVFVRMAGLALFLENEVLVLNPVAERSDWFVATIAADPGMRTREGELGFVVLEAGGVLPLILRMALLTIGAERSAVDVVMTTCACPTQAEQRLGKVVLFQFLPGGVQDMLGLVTLLAGQPGVTSLQHEPGLAVIELGFRNTPADQLEGPPIVLSVTSGTVTGSGVAGSPDDLCVIAGFLFQAPADLHVAIQALEMRSTCSKTVAAGAL